MKFRAATLECNTAWAVRSWIDVESTLFRKR